MPRVLLDPTDSALVIVDIQPKFLAAIHESGRVLEHSHFLAQVAQILEIPVFATAQVPDRMGSNHESLLPTIAREFPKTAFSAVGAEGFMEALGDRKQIVIVGIETHICVSQTAQHLLERGFQVVVCPDAVSSRTLERHKLGMERIRDAGVVPAHTEGVAYEWMKDATHPKFKEVLNLVKPLS